VILRRPAHKRPVTRGVAVTLGAVITALVVGMGAAFGYFLSTDSAKPAVATAATLSVPTKAHVTAKTATSVALNWALPGTQLTGAKYEVTRTSTSNVVCTVTAPSHTCTSTGLVPGTTYNYSVFAFLPSTNWTSSTSTTSATTTKATVAITTRTSATSVILGQSIHDTATLSGGYSPSGTITWHVYSSTTATCSTPQGSYVNTQPVSGTTYASGGFTPTAIGSFKWGFTYSGDAHNKAITRTAGCGGSTEAFSVVKTTPTLSTSAGSSMSVGNSVHDTATLSNGYNETGTLTFTLYTTSSCTTQVGGTVTKTVTGNGTYTSPTITPTVPGTYYWTAKYTGDPNNNAVSEPCNSTGESVSVTARTPTITTTSSMTTVIAGGSLTDTAHISGGYDITGTLTWHVYFSTTTSCTTAQLGYTGTQTVDGTGPYSPTASFPASTVGSYKWGLTYAPGATTKNTAVSLCGGTNESFSISRASPALSTTASIMGKAGTAIIPSSTLAAGASPTGTITWKVFKSSSAPTTCTSGGTTWTGSTATAAGNSTYSPTSAFTPKVAGTYWWYATFTDTDGNNSGATSLCNTADMAHTVVSKATPSVTAGAPATDSVNTAIAASAISATLTATSGTNATGTITWRVFGPQTSAPTTCTSGYKNWTSSAATVSGTTVTYHPTAGYTPTSTGTYWWYASFNDTDGNNTAATSTCGTGMTKTVVYAANGSGTMTVTPTSVTASSTTTLAFTYSAATGGMTDGIVTVNVPTGWTAPTTSTAAGFTKASGGTGSDGVTIATSTRTIKVSGVTLTAGSKLTITYGATSYPGTATATTGTSTFVAKEASLSSGTPVALSSSPLEVAVTSPGLTYKATGAVTTWTTCTHSFNCLAKTVAYPTGTTTGDLLILVVANEGHTLGSGTKTPTGWTPAPGYIGSAPSTGPALEVFWKVAASADGGHVSVQPQYAGNSSHGDSDSAWVIRYEQSSGTLALAGTTADGIKATASTRLTPGTIATTIAGGTEISIAVESTSAVESLTAAHTFVFRGTATTATTGSSFGIADQYFASTHTAPTGPKWKSTSSGAWAWVTLAFTQ
jgi:Fibronectin type III domain